MVVSMWKSMNINENKHGEFQKVQQVSSSLDTDRLWWDSCRASRASRALRDIGSQRLWRTASSEGRAKGGKATGKAPSGACIKALKQVCLNIGHSLIHGLTACSHIFPMKTAIWYPIFGCIQVRAEAQALPMCWDPGLSTWRGNLFARWRPGLGQASRGLSPGTCKSFKVHQSCRRLNGKKTKMIELYDVS